LIQCFGKILELTNGRKIHDITPKIKDWINSEEINSGLLTLNIKHTSASLLVNENYDSDVLHDLENFLAKLVIDGDEAYNHILEGPDDMSAHIRTALTQTNLSFSVRNKEINLGTWQGIFLYEHRFGCFERCVDLHFIGE
jgi:secondary thiamine-phosphate synthase enzyme